MMLAAFNNITKVVLRNTGDNNYFKIRAMVCSCLCYPWNQRRQRQENLVFTPIAGRMGVARGDLIMLHDDKESYPDSNESSKKQESKRLAEFRKKLRETTDIKDLGEQADMSQKDDALPAWPDNTNPHTGEVNGPRGPEPTRYGDWERKGRVSDF